MFETSENPITMTREIFDEFTAESLEHLSKAEDALLAMEKNPGGKAEINSAFRSFHTIKGSADYLGFKGLKELAHFCEEILDTARGDGRVPEKNITAWLIRAVDAAAGIMKRGAAMEPEKAREHSDRAASDFLGELGAGIINGLTAPQAQPASGAIDGSDDYTPEQGPVLKIDANKFSAMMDLINGISIAADSLKSTLAGPGFAVIPEIEGLQKKAGALAKMSAKLEQDSNSMKMMPFQYLFIKMNRLVRDLSIKSGKNITLMPKGGGTEIDREIIENLSEPIMHIIRNSVDHGIENSEEREKTRKGPRAMISLFAFCRDGNVTVSVSDDGRGLDLEKIKNKAVKLGLIGEGTVITAENAGEIIMTPGFSTAGKVTELSGRGVGMDVVKKTVEQLKGRISIKSVSGQGTKISMIFPVNMAVMDALTVTCKGSIFIIPAVYVTSVEEHFGGKKSELPDKCLNEGLGCFKEPLQRGIRLNIEVKGENRPLLVEKILSRRKTVIKNINAMALDKTVFSGATLLPGGQPAMIISPERLFKRTGSKPEKKEA